MAPDKDSVSPDTLIGIGSVRRNILLLTGSAIIVGLITLYVALTGVIYPAYQAAPSARNRFGGFGLFVAVVLLGMTYAYLRPITQLGRFLARNKTPPAHLAQQARTCAFNTSLYLFAWPLSIVGSTLILANVFTLIARPDTAFTALFADSLLILVATVTLALLVSLLSRRLLRPVLVVTADSAQDIGHRYEIRTRLFIIVLSTNFVIFFFLGVLTFNQVYRMAVAGTADQFTQWGRDIAQVAPNLADDALLALIIDSEILTQHKASASLVDSDGQNIALVSGPSKTRSLDTSDAAPGQLIEQNGRFAIAFSIERDDDTWLLSVTYALAPQNVPAAKNTLLILLFFGAVVLGFALAATSFLSQDITRDLAYITSRLLDIARRGHVGAKVHALSLDEVGDLITAFDRARERLEQQQNEASRRVEQLRQLHEASLVLASSVEFQPMLDRICQAAREITASDAATLLLYNPEDDSMAPASHVGSKALSDPVEWVHASGMARAVLNDREAVLVEDTQSHPLIDPSMAQSVVRSVMVVPVISRSQVMGVLTVNSTRVNAYDNENLQLVLALASQAAAAIENARLLDETMATARALEQRARNLVMINRISTDLTSLLDPYQIFNATAKHMVNLMDVDHCSVLIFQERAADGIVVAEYPEIGTVGLRLPRAGNPAIDQVLTTRKPLAISDIQQEPMIGPMREELNKIGVRAILIAPLIARDEVIGTIGLDVLHRPYAFSNEEQELCRTVAAQAAIAVANARLLYDTQQKSRALTLKSLELAKESSRLDAVLTNMADGLVVTDLGGRIILSNPAFRRMAGLPTSEPLRDHLLDEAFAVAELKGVIADAVADVDQVATADLDLNDGRVLRASASALRLEQRADALQGDELTGVVTVLRDITHEVEVDRMKTEFISAVSHELRTPLTSILGFASLIRRAFRRRIAPFIPDDDSTQRAANRILENLYIIETESKRLTRLINDVLDIAKIESGRMEWHMTDIDIAEVINSSINTTVNLAQERKLTLDVVIPRTLPLVWGDHDRLVQVLTNLLANAIKFTEKGGITISSWVLGTDDCFATPSPLPADLQAPALIVAVADTGIGIAVEDLSMVFDRFRQIGDTLTEKPKGSGLGLSICKELVEQHGGVIWVESEPGVGSTFYFALPLSDDQITVSKQRLPADASKAAKKHAAAEGSRAEAVSTRKAIRARKIMVVDDEANIRQLLREELSDAGFEVTEAADGNAALAQARSHLPNLIILDLLMPGPSGFSVTSELRTDPATANIPIVILSVAEEAREALDLGADACLTKPVDVPRLLSTIEQLLEQNDQNHPKSDVQRWSS